MTDYANLIENLEDTEYRLNENLGKYTFYGTGGNCEVMIFPDSKEKFNRIYKSLSKPPFILGCGSNLLVSDKGYKGVVINTRKLNKVTLKGNLILAECGAKLSDVIKTATYNSLSGLEFAVGVPASVGGAVCMNAGCYGKSISESVSFVVGTNGTYNNANCKFTYRSSRFVEEPVLEVCFKLKSWDYDTIEAKLEHYKKIRGNKAPKGKSCGSVFKNEEYFAGKLLDEVGLKGFRVGGAKISEKHANFIINDMNATSQDIYQLIMHAKKRVYSAYGIELKEELKYVGEFNGDKI